jgi:hypothetical protein
MYTVYLKNEDNTLPGTDAKNEEKPTQTTPANDNRLPSSVVMANEDTSKQSIDKDVLQNGPVQEKESVDETSSSKNTKNVAQEPKDTTPSLKISTAPLSKSGEL